MVDNISFVDWLNEQMRIKNLSQAELARKAGLHRSMINKLSRGIVIRPDITTYVAIAKALDVSPATVLCIAGFISPDPDLPELEEYKYILKDMSTEKRLLGLDILRTIAASQYSFKGTGRM
jgi:transcriptional regulator with XRE-family HTH domain